MPFGEEPGPPAPVNIPPGIEPVPPTEGPSLRYTPASMMTTGGGIQARGGGQNIVVTLNVQGDGMLAQAVRQAALSAVVDVIAD